MKSSKVCIITRSPLASLLLKGLATKYTIVKSTVGHNYTGIEQKNKFKPKGKKKEKKERQFKIRATFPNPLFAYSGLLSVKPINLLKNDNFLPPFILSK